MYRSLHLLTCSLLIIPLTNAACAQHSGIGIKGGPLASHMQSATLSTNKIPGASLGIYVPLRAGPRMELQPEFLLTSFGARYAMADGGTSAVRTLYAQVPLSFKLYLGNIFNGQVGLQMGRLLTAQQSTEAGRTTVTESYEHWDYGFILGAGADMVSGLDLGLRYYNGLRPVMMDDDGSYPRNRALMLSAGYRVGRLRAPKLNRRRS
ncbi:MAG: PorT family protein [Flavobacteriales bacterium]|nr:PorT family protein [Flavobacteriales bacterium]